MCSLRQATKNTMFDQWLEAIQEQPQEAAGATGAVGPASLAQPGPGAQDCHKPSGSDGRSGSMSGDAQDLQKPLTEVAQYLAGEQKFLAILSTTH